MIYDGVVAARIAALGGKSLIVKICDARMTSDPHALPRIEGYIIESYPNPPCTEIDRIIFNNPATIVFWNDGTKTVVKCSESDNYDPEKGLAMAISKRVLGGYPSFKRLIQEYYVEEKRTDAFAEALMVLGDRIKALAK